MVELIGGNYDVAVFGRPAEEDVPCPACIKGHLVRRESGQGRGAFYGCSNWPYCKHRQPPCPSCGSGLPVKAEGSFRCRDCGQKIEACPTCGGWLRIRTGEYGRFLGSSNYPTCDYTRDIAGFQRKRERSVGAAPWL
ncbi:MAG: topoisomerase DNA-binding C4 zinc finger domain-containing protein [Chloroflexota bacterium]|nr:topoisomerase DNA-binding C4 zinc finger domain-containing protein [Chloroflexota bacterium]